MQGRVRVAEPSRFVVRLILMSRSLLPALVTLLVLVGCGTSGETTATTGSDVPTQPAATSDTTGGATPEPGGSPQEAQPPVDGPLEDRRTGEVRFEGATDCPQEYATTTVRSRDFAFDGTVTAIDDAGVTFEVHEWLVGEGAATVQLRMSPPDVPDRSEASPSYSVGTRLLVSGDDGIAWVCGFTRYHDTETAAAWRS